MRGWKYAVLLLLAGMLLLPGTLFAQGAKLKVGFVYIGPIGDDGWTFSHDQGRKYLERTLPYVETTFAESVAEADVERVMEEMIRRGVKVIFATSFGYMDAVLKVAARHPDVIFEHATGFKRAKNVGTYMGKLEEPFYLAGLVAGRMSKKGDIGFVAPVPIPEVIRIINAFTVGVRETNPKAKVRVVWVNKWFDPAHEREAAQSLLNVGVDLLAHYQDSAATVQLAAQNNVYVVGANFDQSRFGPKVHLTAAVWNWGPLYVEIVKRVRAGTWKSEDILWGMKEGIVALAPLGPMVPSNVRQLVERRKQEIISGKRLVFTGPIKDQSGKMRIPAGKAVRIEELMGMDWFVEGVIGQIPKK